MSSASQPGQQKSRTAFQKAFDGLDPLEQELFLFLNGKYVQRSDDRQKEMGLQYTEAETHDLAKVIAKWHKGQVRATFVRQKKKPRRRTIRNNAPPRDENPRGGF